jgi:regulation of enolase protein 1 (concanavalin A-like superfamily)
MNFRTTGVGLGILTIVFLAGANHEEYTSKRGNFRIRMPGRPRIKIQKLTTPDGALTITRVAYQAPNATSYSVMYLDLPFEVRAPDEVGRVLDQSLDDMLQGSRNKQTARKSIHLGDHPGRELRYDTLPGPNLPEKLVTRARAYLVGRRSYVLMVGGLASKVDDKAMADFLDSFSLLEPAGTTAPRKPAAPRTALGEKIDPDGDCRILTDRSGAVIAVPETLHDLSPASKRLNAPRMLQKVPDDFLVEVRVAGLMKPTFQSPRPGGRESSQGAGLLYWQDDDHFARFERTARNNGATSYVLVFLVWSDGREAQRVEVPASSASAVLRLEREGQRIVASRFDGSKWEPLKPADVDWPEGGQVGVVVTNTGASKFAPRFDQFKLEDR